MLRRQRREKSDKTLGFPITTRADGTGMVVRAEAKSKVVYVIHVGRAALALTRLLRQISGDLETCIWRLAYCNGSPFDSGAMSTANLSLNHSAKQRLRKKRRRYKVRAAQCAADWLAFVNGICRTESCMIGVSGP